MNPNSLADQIIAEDIRYVELLLQSGYSANEVDEYGFTPLIEAAIADNVQIAQLLLNYGAQVNAQDMIGGTALHWAVENNNLDLTELLLKHRADPNAYNLSGQAVLVMPLLRNQHEIKKLLQRYGADLSFAQDFINTKLLGHMFELVGTTNIVSPQNQFVEVDFEGFFLEISLALIGDSLAQFKNHFAARRLRRFDELTHLIIQVIKHAASAIKFQQYRVEIQRFDQDIDALLKQEPIIIPVGYEGHAITFIKLGGVLVKCDRREDSRLYDNIVFYQVQNMAAFNTQLIKDLMYAKQSSEFVNEHLPILLDLKVMTELKVEAQISGNCSWANVEACIPAVFFLLLLVSADAAKQVSHYKGLALDYFHDWRDWNKKRALQFCIKSFKSGDKIRNACKAEILTAILFQRCDNDSEKDQEHIEMILNTLTEYNYLHLLQNYLKIYHFEGYTEQGKQLSMMLKKHGIIK